MKFGVVFPQMELGGTREVALECIGTVEAAGYHYLLTFDHVIGADTASRPDWSGAYDVEDLFHEPFVFLAHVAALSRLHFMTGVLVAPQRQTVLLAKQAAELDLVSEGRLRLGVGLGWNEIEYESLGVDFAQRGPRLEEQIEVMRLLWSRPSIDYSGQFHRIDRAGILPRPRSGSIPIWMGTAGMHARPLDRIGRLADGWNPLVMPGPDLERATRLVAESAVRAGRDPSALTLEGRIRVKPSDSASTVLGQAELWREAGADFVAVDTLHHGLTAPEHLARIAELGTALNSAAAGLAS